MFKVLKMLIFMFGIYFLIQLAFTFLGDGHEVQYEIKNNDDTFSIKEVYTHNQDGESDSYYIEVKHGETVFPFQLYEDLNNSKTIITNVEYYQDDEYECILPIFRDNKLYVDIMCLKNNVLTYYNNMNINNDSFNTFLTSLADYNYTVDKYKNNLEGVESKNFADLYTNNLQDNYYAALTHYVGVYTIGNETTDLLNKIVIFDNGDVYNQEISGFVGNNFVIADYNNQHDFSEFIVINCKSSAVTRIETNNDISFNSYVQGTAGNSIFIYDRDNKVQYEINVKDKKVIKNNAENGITYYENGEKKHIEVTTDEDIIFTNTYASDYENDRYYRIDKVGGETGYYYLYKQNGNGTDIYRMNVQNQDIITYIATANEIRDIKYIDDYIYYIDGDYINFYSDRSGFRTLLKAKELRFNQTIKYGVFKR